MYLLFDLWGRIKMMMMVNAGRVLSVPADLNGLKVFLAHLLLD